MDAVSTDFESEGLLDGVEGEAREARRRLLEELHEDGVPLEELKSAVEEDRLVLLPVERVYDPPGDRYTPQEVAEQAGVPLPVLVRHQRALGLRVPEEGEKNLGANDLEMAKQLRAFLDAGLPEDALLDVTRVIGLAMAQVSRAVSLMTAQAVVNDAGDERDVATRLADAARMLNPMVRLHRRRGPVRRARRGGGPQLSARRTRKTFTGPLIPLTLRSPANDHAKPSSAASFTCESQSTLPGRASSVSRLARFTARP
jgi:hypothetical protein